MLLYVEFHSTIFTLGKTSPLVLLSLNQMVLLSASSSWRKLAQKCINTKKRRPSPYSQPGPLQPLTIYG